MKKARGVPGAQILGQNSGAWTFIFIGIGASAVIALLQGSGTIQNRSVVALVFIGGVAFSIGVVRLGWIKRAPHAIAGRLVRAAFAFTIIGGAMAFVGWESRHTPAAGKETERAEHALVPTKSENQSAVPKSTTPEQNQSIIIARAEHLKQLHASLQKDSYNFKTRAEKLVIEGQAVPSSYTNHEQYLQDKEVMWRPDVLSADLKNHYPEYSKEKTAVEKEVTEQDAATGTLLDDIEALIPADAFSPDKYNRRQVALSYLDKCQGRESMKLQVDSRGSYSFVSHGGNQSGGGGVPEELDKMYRAFKSLQAPPEIDARCSELAKESKAISKKLLQLNEEAQRLAQVMVLSGNCSFLPQN